MAYELKNKLVIGISSRILFDLQKENEIFETNGKDVYCKYQLEHEKEICNPGPGFAFVKALLALKNKLKDKDTIEIILMSHNSAEISLRLFHSISYYGLDIKRSVFSGGESLKPYFSAFHLDLFLSENVEDVQNAINMNISAGLVQNCGVQYLDVNEEEVRFAFDGDSVLFSNASETIFQEKGLEEFENYEEKHAKEPLQQGPFAKLLKKLMMLKQECNGNNIGIRTALVTSRSAPAHERVIRTLQSWNVQADQTFFLGGIEKKDILSAYGAHIFFDDQMVHINPASEVVFSARVLQKC